ncbi:helix-turn-helix domain-containing protein [Aquimarina macrocephali]|uniref:helix-turn-helix domain-containing protein n=1 Tax=Aquimarina macrocephali TaxID=666563 RepID=UPI000465B35F|nr:helix-turn-helix domain-containing protein [Aquimarina macrocephali]
MHLKKRPSLLLLLLFSLISIVTNAQETKFETPDSLKNITPEELENLIRSSDTTKIKVYEKVVMSSHKNDTTTTKLYIRLAWFFLNKESFTKSLKYFKKAASIAEELKNEKLLRVIYTGMGHVHLLDGKYPEALDAYFLSLDVIEKIDDLRGEIITLSGIVTILKRMGQLDRALKITQRILRLTENSHLKNKLIHSRVLTTSNEIYLALEEYDSVLYFADKGIEISKLFDDKKTLAHLYIEKGMVYYNKKNYDESFNYLFQSEELLANNKINRNSFPQALTYYFIASCYYQQGYYDLAIEYILKITKTAKGNDFNKMSVIQAYLLLANCYGEKKDFKTAISWHNKYMRLIESYEKEKDETANKIFERDSQKLQNRIEDLKNKQDASEKVKTYSLVGSGLLILMLMAGGYLYVKKQKSNTLRFNDLIEKINRLERIKGETRIKQKSTKITSIDESKVQQILLGLNKLEDQDFFLRKDCSLNSVAKKIKTNSTYLSKVINIHKEKNFSNYINDLRIDYITNKLKKDTVFRKYTVDAIAQEIGFTNSKSFSVIFHKKTGIYPSYFIKQLEKEGNQIL